MSLDVSLYDGGYVLTFRGIMPLLRKVSERELFSRNITHNLNTMAEHAGLYQALWRPEELKISRAHELIPILRRGLQNLKDHPEHFKTYNPENGWGDYDGLVMFTTEYLRACEDYPDARIRVSR